MIKIGFKACRMKTFKMKLENLPDVVYSISEKKIPYKICSLQGDILTVQRESTENFVELDINELYEYFTEETTYNTQTARKHITGYAYSPAPAIINALVKSE